MIQRLKSNFVNSDGQDNRKDGNAHLTTRSTVPLPTLTCPSGTCSHLYARIFSSALRISTTRLRRKGIGWGRVTKLKKWQRGQEFISISRQLFPQEIPVYTQMGNLWGPPTPKAPSLKVITLVGEDNWMTQHQTHLPRKQEGHFSAPLAMWMSPQGWYKDGAGK